MNGVNLSRFSQSNLKPLKMHSSMSEIDLFKPIRSILYRACADKIIDRKSPHRTIIMQKKNFMNGIFEMIVITHSDNCSLC